MKTLFSIIAVLGMLYSMTGYAGDETSPYFKVPVGSTLTLNEPLTIQAGKASVYMQYGRVLPFSQIDNFYPNCDFEVRTIAKSATKINPDTFVITRVVYEEEFTAAGMNVFASRGDGGPSHVDYMTVLYLESVKQPDVLRITCTHWEDPPEAEFLSIQQMRKAMGKLLTLNIR